MRVTIDRFEGDYAICEKEDKQMMEIEIFKLPNGVKEGDILIIQGNKIYTDLKDTSNKKKTIKKLVNKLWED